MSETRMPAGVAPDGSVVFHPKFAIDDIVRVIGVVPGTMIESYLGSEGRVIDMHPKLPLYTVELDVGRRNIDRGGQLGPRFVVKEEHLDPDVTEKMIEAGLDLLPDAIPYWDDQKKIVAAIYRAMRAARFER